jgi:hypothetical protein
MDESKPTIIGIDIAADCPPEFRANLEEAQKQIQKQIQSLMPTDAEYEAQKAIGEDVCTRGVAEFVDQMNKEFIESEQPHGIYTVTEGPRSPAPPQRPNAVKAHETPTAKSQAKAAHIKELLKMPDIELVEVNGVDITPTYNREIGIQDEPQGIASKFPPGFDLTKKIVHNPGSCVGAMGRKAARIKLKEARKLQKQHLKETGFFDRKKAEMIAEAIDIKVNGAPTQATLWSRAQPGVVRIYNGSGNTDK